MQGIESPHCTPKMQKEGEAFITATVSYSFLLSLLGALAVSAAVLIIGLLIVSSVIIPPVAPVVVGTALLYAGAASTGFFGAFAHHEYKHLPLVNASEDNNIPQQN